MSFPYRTLLSSVRPDGDRAQPVRFSLSILGKSLLTRLFADAENNVELSHMNSPNMTAVSGFLEEVDEHLVAYDATVEDELIGPRIKAHMRNVMLLWETLLLNALVPAP
jgi:hypothetical protein